VAKKADGKLRVGVIGLGWAGQAHCKGYMDCPDCELVAVCDLDRARAEKVAGEYGIEAFTDIESFLKSAGVEAVSVCLPNYLHFPGSRQVLLAGKHVFCEKPPMLNASEALKIRDLAADKDRIAMYAFVQRFSAESQFLKKIIESGEFGDIYYGKATYTRRRGIPIGAKGWFVDKSRSGGGALIDIGVHPLDRVWWLMGNPRPASVLAGSYSLFGRTIPKGVKYDVDDNTFALFRMENGSTLIVEATWAWNLPAVGGAQISGTKAGATLNPFTIYSEKNGATIATTPDIRKNQPFSEETAHFVGAVLGKHEPLSNADQGYQLMAMIDAAYKSAGSGREAKIKLK